MLKALLLRKKIDLKKKELESLRASMQDVERRESELVGDIEEVSNEEEQAAVQESVDALTEEKEKLQGSIDELDKIINDLEAELETVEQDQNTEPDEPAAGEPEERSKKPMKIIRSAGAMTIRERLGEMITREDVKSYLGDVRACMREKRSLTNVGLTVPEVFLGFLRENLENYSKLYKHVTVRQLKGEGRMVIMGAMPEAIWTDCCGNLNELTMAFYGQEIDCYKVAGYFAVCNATLEDSDLDLAAELVTALGQAIGIALDKAILYGRNTAAASKMPEGIVTRLVQTSKPDSYPAQARPWEDLHTSNVKTIDSSTTGVALFQGLTINCGAAKGKYSAGTKVHVMNETTLNFLKAQGMNVNAAGAIVTGMEGTMPVVGGQVETLDFIPDYVIISGYFDCYLLGERAGKKFASSEHVRFLQDQTVFKGTARYDGCPAIAEAFVAQAINGASVDATAVSFGEDEANKVKAIALNTATATVAVSAKTQLFAIVGPGSGTVTWASGTTAKATVDSNGVVTGVASGNSTITATCNGLTATCTVTVVSE